MDAPRAGSSPPAVHEAALRLLAGTAPGKLLDVPCGTGSLAHRLAVLGWRVEGGDRDPEPARALGLPVVGIDLEAPLPFEAGAYDAVVCLEGIEHVEGQAALLRELARVLLPGGVLVLSTPNVLGRPSRSSLARWGYARFFRPTPPGARTPFEHEHRHPIDVVRLDFLLREAGLRPEAWDGDAGRGERAPLGRRALRRLLAPGMRRHNARADLLLDPAVWHGRVLAVRARKPRP